jgi:glutathione S-transferase
MIELYQTEWCPASRRVRQRLTELAVDYVIHQVPAEKADRSRLIAATGTDTIPVVVLDDGTTIASEPDIMRWLDAHIAEPAQAKAHRERADRLRQRELAEARSLAGARQ